MTGEGRPALRLIRGGLGDLSLAGIAVEIVPFEEAEITVDAVVVEEDTWLVLSAAREFSPVDEHPIRLFTELMEAEPLPLGTVLVREGQVTRLLAVVYDLGADPSWTPEGLAAVAANIAAAVRERRITALAMPVPGARYGRAPLRLALAAVQRAFRAAAPAALKRILLLVPLEEAGHVRRELVCLSRETAEP